MTAKRLKRPRDPVQLGKLIGDILTGQVEDRALDRPKDSKKDQAAVALGRKGGLKGGRARADKMSAAERPQRPLPKALATFGHGLASTPKANSPCRGTLADAIAKRQ